MVLMNNYIYLEITDVPISLTCKLEKEILIHFFHANELDYLHRCPESYQMNEENILWQESKNDSFAKPRNIKIERRYDHCYEYNHRLNTSKGENYVV